MGGRGFAGATSRRSAKLEKQISAANAELSQYDADLAEATARADVYDATYEERGYGKMSADERAELIEDYLLEDKGYSYEQISRFESVASKRAADQAELDRLNHGQFALFNVTTRRR